MLEAGCGFPVVRFFSSFFTATVLWVLAEELILMGTTSGNLMYNPPHKYYKAISEVA